MGRGRKPSSESGTRADASFFGWTRNEVKDRPPRRPTVICLPLIDWGLRVQRPHHLLARLAARGWPVLYARTELGGSESRIEIDAEPVAPGVRTVTIPSARPLQVGEGSLRSEDLRIAVAAFAELRHKERIHQAVVLCHSPRWRPLAESLREEHGWPVVYDRMDLHEGFSTTDRSIGEEERALLAAADLVIATSEALALVDHPTTQPVLRLPNACEPGHWEEAVPGPELGDLPRPLIGYFGAISEWFDTRLVEDLAIARPQWSIVLVGSTWGADVSRLERLPNVRLLGERPYHELPSLAAAFDVGLIPFKRTPLTEATDPVKLYEMMALGLEIVARPLPEISRHSDLVNLAEDTDSFVDAVERALAQAGDVEAVARRRAFARANTWEARVEVLEEALIRLFPPVTIGIVTFNNRELTELCLDSIGSFTVHPNYEVVVVDNASEDGTAEWLKDEVAARPGHRVILNATNRGFAAACNQAFADSNADILCFLNNDTVVTTGWLAAMVRTLMGSREIGLVGPSTGGVANEAKVAPGYAVLAGLHDWAEGFVSRHEGESFSIPMLALYCAALRRSVWEELGGLDERFEVGLFEDDDFSRRIRRAGYDVRCLRDAWVHHFQEASFGMLPVDEYERIYEANRRRFQSKWNGPESEER
jgi:GT2 family glycosyltransferase/glycosyltransferase involved in cell wall biosynthesis